MSSIRPAIDGLGSRLALVAAAALAGCEPELGALPARCDDGATCPEGYVCARGVCAEPSTRVPSTIARLQSLRTGDWQLLPHADGALAIWERYDYERERSAFDATTIAADGAVGPTRVLVEDYPADSDNLEPYFDAYAAPDGALLLAIGAAPFDASDAPRLTVYRAGLDRTATAPQWEARLRSLGYGAVSQPRFAADADGLWLGYFESVASGQSSRGELALFALDAAGQPRGPLDPEGCAGQPDCCQAVRCVPARDGTTLAVGVDRVLVDDAAAWWLLDDVRPSFVRGPLDATPVEGLLPRDARPVGASGDVLTVLVPIPGGVAVEELATAADGTLGSPTIRASIDGIALDPRPAWIDRPGGDPLLVGQSIDGALVVGAVASEGLRGAVAIERYSSRPVASVRATLVDGRVTVAWLEQGDEIAVLRALVVEAP